MIMTFTVIPNVSSKYLWSSDVKKIIDIIFVDDELSVKSFIHPIKSFFPSYHIPINISHVYIVWIWIYFSHKSQNI